jgi:Secretion system C-terminal sorting domain
MKHIFLFLCLSLLALKPVSACTCFPIGQHFCETLQNDTSIDNVVMVEKLADYYYGMQVRKLTLIGGNVVPDTFLVWGDNGGLCRIPVGGISNGDTVILALNRCDTLGNWIWNSSYPPDLESITDYHVSICGYYALRVTNGQVTGYINTPQNQSMSLSSFLALPCLLLSTPEQKQEQFTCAIFPNPASQQINITGEKQLSRIAIYSMTGQIVLVEHIEANATLIDIAKLDDGYYFIEVWSDQAVFRDKITIVR